MPIKINELIVQIKVHESNKQVESTRNTPVDYLLPTEQQKMLLAKDFLHLLEEQEVR